MALSNDDYTVAWISALHHERASAEALLDEEHDDLPLRQGDDNSYTLGKIGLHNVVIAGMGTYGTTSAATVAANLLRSFPNIRFGLLVGVGGGVPGANDLRLGDVVVSTPEGTNGGVIQYDFGTAIQEKKFVRRGCLNKPPAILTNAIGKLRSKADRKGYGCWQHYDDMLKNNPKMKLNFLRPNRDDLYEADYVHEGGSTDCVGCSAKRRADRPQRLEQEEEPLVFYGTIGSANQVLRDAQVRDELHKQTGIICFEMEAAGLMDNFPCIVIRGISDYADTHKNKDWQPYAGAVAAAFAKELVLSIPPSSVVHIPQANQILKEVNNLSIRQDEQAKQLYNIEAKIDFTKLPCVKGAAYNSFADIDELDSRCLPGTRVDLLDEVRDWSANSSKGIFWLNGMAGTGKSTIARTLAAEFDDKKQLGASFFFKRGQGDRSGASSFFTTIASQLVQTIPELRPLISQVIEDNPRVADTALQQQFEQLILQPLQEIRNSFRSICVMVIDALDECDNEFHIRNIVTLFSQLQSVKTMSIKTIITSRPELPPKLGFRKISKDDYQDLILHRIEKTVVGHDIELFLKHRFEQIRFEWSEPVQFSLPLEWPSKNNIETLIAMAVPLFIYAATVCRFIGYRFGNPQERLARVLEYRDKIGLDQMDQTYKPILDRILDAEDARDQSDQEIIIQRFRKVVGPIIVLSDYLSVNTLSILLQVDTWEIACVLNHLHSVLDNADDPDRPIRPLHLSFPNYLLDAKRRNENRFWIDETAMHKHLAYKCIHLLRSTKFLKQDICDYQDPGLLRSEIEQDTLSRYIPAELEYACCYWVQHLEKGQCKVNDQDEIHLFLNERFLFWLEAMSLTGHAGTAQDMMITLHSLVNKNDSPELDYFLRHAREFIRVNISRIVKAPLQVYYSLLVLTPQQSAIRSIYGSLAPKWLIQQPLTKKTWTTEVWITGWHFGRVFSVAFSPNGDRLASGSRDATIKIWDATTGSLQQTLEEHSKHVYSVTFSPDGKKLASGSGDDTIKIWDATTGALQKTLNGHSDSVVSVTFSPDGKQLASGSHDTTVKIWDVATGSLQQTLESHSERVLSVVFSPHGKQMASGSDDTTVRIWSLATGSLQRTLEGHSAKTTSVAFSPDEKQLASGSWDNTIKIWDVATGSLRQTIEVQVHISRISFHPTLAILDTNAGKIVFDDQDISRISENVVDNVWVDGAWIMRGNKRLLLLPNESKPGVYASMKQRLAIGSTTGEVLFFKFSFEEAEIANAT